MFKIIEDKSVKLPSVTSLFFKMDFYSSNIFENLIHIANCHYHKNERLFELPISKLYFLVTLLIKYDDVEIVFNEESKMVADNDVDYSEFKIQPLPHQKDAVEYGLNHNNWLLLDQAGLGKTKSIIYLADELRKRTDIEHCLIICGVNSLKRNWVNEIEETTNSSCRILGQKFTRNGKMVIKSVADRCAELREKIDEFFIITNKETLRDKKFIEAFRNSKNKFDCIVVDEIHKCVNPSSAETKTLLKLDSKHKIGLSGTLLMNRPENAYASLKFTKNINSNFTEFKNMYNVYGGYGNVQIVGHKNLDLLKDLINSCSLRRLKTEVLDLPPISYSIEYVELTPKQQVLYDEVSVGIQEELDKLPPNSLDCDQEITLNLRKRQVTAFTGILSEDIKESAKLDRACDLVEEIVAQGDKVIIFNTFKESAEELYTRLHRYNPVLCTGNHSESKIEENKNKFNNDETCKVFIATWQKMGTGHTLNSANYVIFIDTPYTDGDFDQSSERAWRIGQTKSVFIITIVAKDTYDERVLEIVKKKGYMCDYIIDNQFSNNLIQLEDF